MKKILSFPKSPIELLHVSYQIENIFDGYLQLSLSSFYYIYDDIKYFTFFDISFEIDKIIPAFEFNITILFLKLRYRHNTAKGIAVLKELEKQANEAVENKDYVSFDDLLKEIDAENKKKE